MGHSYQLTNVFSGEQNLPSVRVRFCNKRTATFTQCVCVPHEDTVELSPLYKAGETQCQVGNGSEKQGHSIISNRSPLSMESATDPDLAITKIAYAS